MGQLRGTIAPRQKLIGRAVQCLIRQRSGHVSVHGGYSRHQSLTSTTVEPRFANVVPSSSTNFIATSSLMFCQESTVVTANSTQAIHMIQALMINSASDVVVAPSAESRHLGSGYKLTAGDVEACCQSHRAAGKLELINSSGS